MEVGLVGVNRGESAVLAHHQNAGVGEAGRRLLQASKVLRMDRRDALVFLRDAPHPIRCRRVKYFEAGIFEGLWTAGGTVRCLRRSCWSTSCCGLSRNLGASSISPCA